LLSLHAYGQSLTYRPGHGIRIASSDNQWSLRTLGYIQSTFTYLPEQQNGVVSNEFFIRRARLDIIFDYLDKYQVFFELDGRGNRTELVLAQVEFEYARNHSILAGKFITPFSPENNRSSRELSTVERYSALNSLFLLPTLDTQYGIMISGTPGSYEYYLSVTNGNGKASDNIRENNNAKDIQARVVREFSSAVQAGLAFHYSREQIQTLSLYSHTFHPFNSARISGGRIGWLLDFEYQRAAVFVRGEGYQYRYQNPLSPQQQVRYFRGGYGEVGYFLFGDRTEGFQLIGRYEQAAYIRVHASLRGPRFLHSFILGHNWYKDGIFRLQTNFVYDVADQTSVIPESRFEGKHNTMDVLMMLQIKF